MEKTMINLFIFFVSTSVFAASVTADKLKTKYGVVEGEYKLISGSTEECAAGVYKVFKGKAGVFSLKAGNGLMARNIQAEVVNFRERNCSMNYTTTLNADGFQNIEAVNCADSKVSYTRKFQAKFVNKKLQYKLSSHRITEGVKNEINCLLELVEE